jgi:hypothetical protein
MVKILRKRLPVAALVLSSSLVFLTYAFIHSKIEHRLAAEHLERAKIACGDGPGFADADDAMKQLSAIPEDAPEQAEAAKIREIIEDQQLIEEFEDREARIDRAVRNFRGELHDPFVCKKNPDGQVSVSFDDGQEWWKDDGRCAKKNQRLIEEEKRLIGEDNALYAALNDLGSQNHPGELDAKQFDSVSVFYWLGLMLDLAFEDLDDALKDVGIHVLRAAPCETHEEAQAVKILQTENRRLREEEKRLERERSFEEPRRQSCPVLQ